MRRILITSGLMLSLLPAVPAAAASTTYSAPYGGLRLLEDATGSVPSVWSAEATAEAGDDPIDGTVRITASADSLNPAAASVGGLEPRARAEAELTLGSLAISSGRVRVTVALAGSVSAEVDATLIAGEVAGIYDGSWAQIVAEVLGSPVLLADVGADQAVLEQTVDASDGDLSFAREIAVTPGGFCPQEAQVHDVTLLFEAGAQAYEISSASASAELTVESVTIEELPCVAPPPIVDVDVSSETFAFEPGSLTVPEGTQVRWTWSGDFPHTVTASDTSFASGVQDAGTFTHTFATAGTYGYYCELHGTADGEGMAGVVNVI